MRAYAPRTVPKDDNAMCIDTAHDDTRMFIDVAYDDTRMAQMLYMMTLESM